MNYTINDRPCLMLEAAMLVFSYVNHLPADQLTCSEPYAIPAQNVEDIRAAACTGLDLEDQELQFYFQGVRIADRVYQQSCLALHVLYCRGQPDSYEVRDMVSALKRSWQEQTGSLKIFGINSCGLSIMEAESFVSLAEEIAKLPIPPQYQMKLVEALSNYPRHVERLGQILEPVAERLKPLLEPWVIQAAPRRTDWAEFLSQDNAASVVLQESHVTGHELQNVIMTMRYFFPKIGTGNYRVGQKEIVYHMGVTLLPQRERPEECAPLSSGDFAVLRLLSSPERFNIFWAVRREPKSMQELTVELDLNPGTVFRNVNKLYNEGLLELEIISGRNCYRADIARLERVTAHMIRYLKEDG